MILHCHAIVMVVVPDIVLKREICWSCQLCSHIYIYILNSMLNDIFCFLVHIKLSQSLLLEGAFCLSCPMHAEVRGVQWSKLKCRWNLVLTLKYTWFNTVVGWRNANLMVDLIVIMVENSLSRRCAFAFLIDSGRPKRRMPTSLVIFPNPTAIVACSRCFMIYPPR